MLNRFLNTTFGIRDGEKYISFLMQLYLFLIITALLIVKPSVNALFLSKLGSEHLPYGYILVAITAVLAITYYNKGAKKFSLLRVTSLTLLFFGLGFLGLCIILSLGLLNPWTLYIYYVGVSLFALIATSQFWMLSNLVFNPREAKRLFGFIGAGGIAGGIFGGYLTSIITSSFGNVTAIIIAAVFILVCIPIIHKIWTLRVKRLNPTLEGHNKLDDSNTDKNAFQIIINSKHLSYLAIIVGLGVMVAKLVDFQFSDFAHQSFINANELASFFGFWFSTFNVVALALQLFATNRVLSGLGVSKTLLILPFGIVLGSLLFFVFPELWVLIIIKGIDGSFKQSLNKSAVELSIMPIPIQEKKQAKSFIDVAVDSMATGITGLILILLIRKFNLHTVYITLLILVLSGVWIFLIYQLKTTYFNSFRTNIQRTITKQPSGFNKEKRHSSLGYVRNILQSGDEDEIISVLKYLSSYRVLALKDEIISLLDHPSSKVKTGVIRQIYAYDKGTAIDKIKPLIHEDDGDLVYSALEYVLDHSHTHSNEFFEAFLDHSNKKIARASLLCLAKESSTNNKIAATYKLDDRISHKIEELSALDDFSHQEDVAKLLITIAESRLEKHYPFITINLINSTNPYIVKNAIKAAGITAKTSYKIQLLEFLTEEDYRDDAAQALKNYGHNIVKTILKLEREQVLQNSINKHIPNIVASFDSQTSVKILLRLLKSKDVVIRYESAEALNKLKLKNTSLYLNKGRLKSAIILESNYCKTTLNAIASLNRIIENSKVDNCNDHAIEIAISRKAIVNLLEKQMDLSIRSIFKILELLYDEADINVSYNGIRSEVKEARINALEFLDNLLKTQLKQQVLPVIEYYSIANNQHQYTGLKINYFSEEEILKMLAEQRSNPMKLEILYLIQLLHNNVYQPLVTKLSRHENRAVNRLAKSILKTYEKELRYIS